MRAQGERIARRTSVILAVALVTASCRRRLDPAEAADAEARSSAAPDNPAAGPIVLPARCRSTEGTFVFDDGGVAQDLEVGDSLAYPEGNAVAFAHRTAAGRVASIGLLGPDGRGPMRIVDLGPTLGDAPAPRLAWRSADGRGELVAASYGASRASTQSDAARELAVRSISGTSVAPIASILQQRDDSLGFDLATAGPAGLVVWDEVRAAASEASTKASGEARGVVRASTLTADAGAPRDLSPTDSDAELPRVVANGAGFWVLWIARRPETSWPALEGGGNAGANAGVDRGALEVAGEDRSFGWLELVAVDAHGSAGPVRKLTPPNGHVTGYDARALPGGTGPVLLVVARDEGEAVDGSGGGLLRVRVTPEGAEAAVGFATDGLGRGAPAFVDGDPPWLTWVGPREQLRLLPLDRGGAPAAPASAEDALAEGRPLLLLRPRVEGGGDGGDGGDRADRHDVPGPAAAAGRVRVQVRVLAAVVSDSEAELRTLACR